MATIKSYTDIDQSKKLSEILPIKSADMYYWCGEDLRIGGHKAMDIDYDIPCWSLAALLNILPEINGIPLKVEKVKAQDGYDGYYYHIEYEGIVLIPYSKNLVDACVAMIENLHELKML